MKNIKILVKGLLNRDWEDWFGGFSLARTTAGETELSGPIRDQAQLRGMVSRISDLGLELISLETDGKRASGTVTGGGETGTSNSPHKGGNIKKQTISWLGCTRPHNRFGDYRGLCRKVR